MSQRFEVLDQRQTPLGDVSLWRRREPTLGVDVYEVKLNDEYLMSSLFHVAEIELARLGLGHTVAAELDVLVGGLGLGYTARAALADLRVRSLTVVEALGEVIDWHERDLLPDTAGLAADPRCRLVQADFFAWAAGDGETKLCTPGKFHAILLDIDHTPRHLLHPRNVAFYTVAGLSRLAGHLQPDGVFALWSDDPPDDEFLDALRVVFSQASTQVVRFANPLTGGESANTIYVATTSNSSPGSSAPTGA